MSKTKIVLLGIAAILVIIVLSFGSWLMGSYNTMVNSSSQVDLAFSSTETQYQRRFDLIPNLAEATKGYMKQEQTVFKDIANARTHYANAGTSSEKVQATNTYESAISRLLIVMENYPVLKSDATVKNLMDELAGTENRIAVARDRYNESARSYNVTIKSFPKNLVASMFGFSSKELFTAEEGASKAVKINLTN